MISDLHARINEAVNAIAAIDVHVHIDAEKPTARSLWDVVSYHNYAREMVAAGMPSSVLEGKDPPEEKAAALAGYFPLSSTSSHSWMLKQILSGLYGWDQPLTPSNSHDLFQRVDGLLKRDDWRQSVQEKAGVVKTVAIAIDWKKAALDWTKPPVNYDRSHYLLLAQLFIRMEDTADTIGAIEQHAGLSISSPASLEQAVRKLAEAWRNSGVCSARIVMDNEPPFAIPERGDVEKALAQHLRGQSGSADLRVLRDFIVSAFCGAAGTIGLVVQVYAGLGLVNGQPFPISPPDLATGLFSLIAANPETKFDLTTVTPEILNQFTIMARHLPNLNLMGCWWFTQFPSAMRRIYRLQAEALPPSKWSAMFTDAYIVEWQYGKSMLIRKELAAALADYVQEGYITEDQAIGVARGVLYDTPAKLYGLEVGL